MAPREIRYRPRMPFFIASTSRRSPPQFPGRSQSRQFMFQSPKRRNGFRFERSHSPKPSAKGFFFGPIGHRNTVGRTTSNAVGIPRNTIDDDFIVLCRIGTNQTILLFAAGFFAQALPRLRSAIQTVLVGVRVIVALRGESHRIAFARIHADVTFRRRHAADFLAEWRPGCGVIIERRIGVDGNGRRIWRRRVKFGRRAGASAQKGPSTHRACVTFDLTKETTKARRKVHEKSVWGFSNESNDKTALTRPALRGETVPSRWLLREILRHEIPRAMRFLPRCPRRRLLRGGTDNNLFPLR